MQAYSPALPVGAQRYYRHGWHALSTIVREEGWEALYRGWWVMLVLRLLDAFFPWVQPDSEPTTELPPDA